MPDGLIIVFFVAFFGLVIAFGVYGYKQNQKRLAALREWATSRQFTFDEAHDSTFDDRFAEFECFREGKRRYAYNIFEGSYRDFPTTAFEYHYETYSKDKDGKQQTHHHYFSAVVIETGLPLKPLWIRPENIFEAPRLSIELQSGRVLARGDGCFDAAGYQGALDTAVGLIELLPDSVRREMHDER